MPSWAAPAPRHDCAAAWRCNSIACSTRPAGVALEQGRIAAQFNEDRLEISELRLAGSADAEQRGGQC